MPTSSKRPFLLSLCIFVSLFPLTIQAQTSVAPTGSGTGADPYQIDSLPNLYWLSQTSIAWADTLVQTSDIDASPTSSWDAGAGFSPIGNSTTQFIGRYNGKKHIISGLAILRTTLDVGLFGCIGVHGIVDSLGLAGGSVRGYYDVGALVGRLAGTLSNSHASTPVMGKVSGLSDNIGGLVGYVMDGGNVINSYATGEVPGTQDYYHAGGLVGYNYGTITNSFATGAVKGYYVGGLAGYNGGGVISNSYATGTVTGIYYAAGLVPNNYGSITNSYATGKVTGYYVGGLVVSSNGTITGSYWDVVSTTQSSSNNAGAGCVGLSTTQMQQDTSFKVATGLWDFTNTWAIYKGHTYPLLRSLMAPLTVTAKDTSKSYDGTAFSGGNGVAYSLSTVGASLILGSPSYHGTSQGAKDTGSYSITIDSLYSTQFGYLIHYGVGALRVNPRALAVLDFTVENKIYDGTTLATLTGAVALDHVVNGEDVTLASAVIASFDTKDIGTAKAVTLTMPVLMGTSAHNYTLTQASSYVANITPAPLTIVGALASNKTYDGTTTATVGGASLAGNLAGDDVALVLGAASFATKDTGTAKPVVVTTSTLTGTGAHNYSLSEVSGLVANITPKTIHVVAIADTMEQGTEPTFTYRVDSLFAGDSLTGTLVREQGDSTGAYAILVGTLAADGNYTIDYTGANVVMIAPSSIHTRASIVAFTGRAMATLFNLQGQKVWNGSLDVINGKIAMPSIGAGRWIVKLQVR